MSVKYRIAVLGIGGVGGYVGGKLAVKYANSADIDIVFIVRGESAKRIRSEGLKLTTDDGEVTAMPAMVSEVPGELGALDLIIVAVKSYDLESSVESIRGCINGGTIILPLQNGIDATQRLEAMGLPGKVWSGCIYLVSKIMEPGVVKQGGSVRQIYIGSPKASLEELKKVEGVLVASGLEAQMTETIEKTLWEKFVFISPIATMTSYLNMSIGQILASKEQKELLLSLLRELKSVADAKGIGLDGDVVEKTFAKMQSLPYEARSSMHGDFQRGARTEIDSLTGYVVKLGSQQGVPTPNHDRLLKELKCRLSM